MSQKIGKLKIISNPAVKKVFGNYPKHIRPKLEYLRELIIETASEIDTIKELEETLKWGEPSYLVKKGTTIRMDWKRKSPDQYAIYFNCQSSIISTLRIIYGNLFKYEKNRAIVFDLDDKIPRKELKDCFELALKYHSLKHQPLLGK